MVSRRAITDPVDSPLLGRDDSAGGSLRLHIVAREFRLTPLNLRLNESMSNIRIRSATELDVPVILDMIRGLAAYEKLGHLVTATEERLRETLFGDKPVADVMLAYCDLECAGFALFFQNYSTFLAQPGIYLEDLYVKPQLRRKGVGLALLRNLASIGVKRGCGRMEWEVLNWNDPSIQFYRKLGAEPQCEWTKYRLTGEALKILAQEDS